MSKPNALGVFIFGGSATFGVEAAGFHVENVLELTDDMHRLNAYHFVKNRPDIGIIPPKTWENESFLKEIRSKNYDLIYCNSPCSSLSQINRNASVEGKHNVNFYRFFRVVDTVGPKAFILENAPTLVKLGYPIILDMVERLGGKYKFTVIRDFAGNHGVAMKRLRTLVIGWKRDYFNDLIPLLSMNKQPKTTIKDVIGDLYDVPLGEFPNHTLVPNRKWKELEYLFDRVKPGETLILAGIRLWDEIESEIVRYPSCYNEITKCRIRLRDKGRIWDKSPCRNLETEQAPSLTSVSEFIHPIHNRQWTIREYARLMGYPDSFEFYPNETRAEIIQTIAQGVPAKFMEYIAGEVREALGGNRMTLISPEDKVLCFQHHTHERFKVFNRNELLQLRELDTDKSFIALQS